MLKRDHSHLMNVPVVALVWLKQLRLSIDTKLISDGIPDATNVDPKIDPKSGNRQSEDIPPDFSPPKEKRKL